VGNTPRKGQIASMKINPEFFSSREKTQKRPLPRETEIHLQFILFLLRFLRFFAAKSKVFAA
jgi:hypothetical protein